MAFTELCCRSGGSNLNAGTLQGDSTEPGTSASFTYASGNWVQSTGVFTVASGDPATDGVAVGDFASVYADGSSITGFVGRITARDATTITVSLTAKAGTAPTDGTGTRTLKVGGAWQGPNGTSWFPLDLTSGTLYTLRNSSSDPVRINLKNDQTYSVTAALSLSQNYTQIEGYTSAYGDEGRATIDSGTSAIDVITATSTAYIVFRNLIGVSTYAGASVNRFIVTGSNGNMIERCVAHGFRSEGFAQTARGVFVECEAYSCGAQGARGGFNISAVNCIVVRCIASNNTGPGFSAANGGSFYGCNASNNSTCGIEGGSSGSVVVIATDLYSNSGDGLKITAGETSHPVVIENCNFIANGGYGINANGSGLRRGTLRNCGFGSGTQANTSGATNQAGGLIETGTVTYDANVTPWEDPANGDFRISLAAAKNAGRGSFTQTEAGQSGTVGYPDIGAAPHQDSGGIAVPQGLQPIEAGITA